MTDEELKAIEERAANGWSNWWFIHGGGIHGARKRRLLNRLAELAELLPKMAWDEAGKDIPALVSEVRRLQSPERGTLVPTDELKKLQEENERLRVALKCIALRTPNYLGGEIARAALEGK